jgi:alkylated DNA repair protein (DNA oxidative demethylase)
MQSDLLAPLGAAPETLAEGAVLLPGFARRVEPALLAEIEAVAKAAPFRRMEVPGGHTMSVAMTGCGIASWVSDRHGYRYAATDPLTGEAWPAMPPTMRTLAADAAAAAGFEEFVPDTCLVNRYAPGARMALHQDRNERDMDQPIVSVSLGLPATFLWGGTRRGDRPRRLRLASGDVVVWGGPARLTYHGIAPVPAGGQAATRACRFNLTFRRAL